MCTHRRIRFFNFHPIYYTSLIFGSSPLEICLDDRDVDYENQEEQHFLARGRRTPVRGSFVGATCFAFWLVAVLMIDVHPFRFRIDATRPPNSTAVPNSTVIFPLLATANGLSKMAIVSACYKILQLLTIFTQSLGLPRLADIIRTFFLVDHCLFKHALSDEGEFSKMEKTERVHFWTIVLGSVVLLWLTFLCMEYNSAESLFNKTLILVDDLSLMAVFTVEMQLYAFCRMLQDRLALLNKELKATVDSIAEKYGLRMVNVKKVEEKVGLIFIVFWKLVDLLEVIVETYRLQIFFGLCLTFVHLLIDIYITMYAITGSRNATWMQALNAKPLRHIFRLVLISVAGSSIKKEVRRTRLVLIRHDLNVYDRRLREKIRVFFMRLNDKNISLSIFCILHLDLPLIISFIEGISSYILIMLQYKWIGK